MSKRIRSPKGSSHTCFFDKENTDFLLEIKRKTGEGGRPRKIPAIVNDIVTEKRIKK